jgi:hypothetical protein
MDEFTDNSPDYVWHFKLSDDHLDEPPDEALTEMLRRQLRAILGCVVLTSSGTDLRITGFRFLSERETEHAIYSEAAPFSELTRGRALRLTAPAGDPSTDDHDPELIDSPTREPYCAVDLEDGRRRKG